MAKPTLEEMQYKAAELQIKYYEQELHARKTERLEELQHLEEKGSQRHAIDERRYQTLKKICC